MTRRGTPGLDELGRRLEAARREGRTVAGRRWRLTQTIGVVLVVLVGLSFTPPGRAVTDRIGALVGIGEVGGPPSEDPTVGRFEPDSGAVVLAAGESSDGFPFEIVAFRSDRRLTPRFEPGTVCVNLDWVGRGQEGGGACYAGSPEGGAVCCETAIFPRRNDGYPTRVPFASGQIAPPTDRVVVTYSDGRGRSREVEAAVGAMDAATADRLGIEAPSGEFFASLPGLEEQSGIPAIGHGAQAPASTVRLTAYDAEGEPLEIGRIAPFDAETIKRFERAAAFERRADAWRDCLKAAPTADEKSACAEIIARP